jgi:hypothetical protein
MEVGQGQNWGCSAKVKKKKKLKIYGMYRHLQDWTK